MTNFKGKTILITGGTGSFGEFFVDYLQGKDFKEVRVFSRDEMKQEQAGIVFCLILRLRPNSIWINLDSLEYWWELQCELDLP